MIINLHLFHRDEAYARKLASELADCGQSRYAITIYFTNEQLNTALTDVEARPDALFLVDYTYKNEAGCGQNTILWLTDGWIAPGEENERYVLASQSVKSIDADIVRHFLETRRLLFNPAEGGKEASIVSLSALTDSETATKRGIDFARTWAAAGKRVLWVSFLPFPIFQHRLGMDRGNTLENIMVHLIRDGSMLLGIDLFTWTDPETGLDFIRPHRIYDDLLSVSEEKWINWFNALRSCGKHDMIIVELGTQVNRLVDSIIKESDQCIVFRKEDEIGKRLEGAYVNRLSWLGHDGAGGIRFVDPELGNEWKEAADQYVT